MSDSNSDWNILRPIEPLSYEPVREMEQRLNELFRAEVQARLASLNASRRARERSVINLNSNVGESDRTRRGSSSNRPLGDTNPVARMLARQRTRESLISSGTLVSESVSARNSTANGSVSTRDSTASGSVSTRSPAANRSSRAPASGTNGVLTIIEEPETGTAHGKYNPVVAIRPVAFKMDKKNESKSLLDERYQCISFMPQYRDKSLEELRLEDYTAGRKKRSIFVFEANGSKPTILSVCTRNHSDLFKRRRLKPRRQLPTNGSTPQTSQNTSLHTMLSNLDIQEH